QVVTLDVPGAAAPPACSCCGATPPFPFRRGVAEAQVGGEVAIPLRWDYITGCRLSRWRNGSCQKVLFSFCKSLFPKHAPSKKELTSLLVLLEREGLLATPSDIYEPDNWEGITSALSHRALTTQKTSEFKTWGLVLGALKAARDEKLANQRAKDLLGIDPGGCSSLGSGPGGGRLCSLCRLNCGGDSVDSIGSALYFEKRHVHRSCSIPRAAPAFTATSVPDR
ncbi:uncharacterized protein LOC107306226, partial [Coturnix japonica]|uniref:uncharacterized protein LOC107306226 n=1 Tax=Coturnix japonica TaxID=93934 RepID=UPI0013A5CE08